MVVENKNIHIVYWLLLVTLLVVIMIVVGGMTRLTDSGLSITEWNLISGIIPPLTLEQWNISFNLYKQIPEFKLLNSTMTLENFKVIFWWEYIHRLLGRMIGIFYIVPLIYFTYKKKISVNYLYIFYSIFLLICLQGFIGWYMVTSGLTERTDVSHYRLSLHLTMAFIILLLLLWNYFKLKYPHNSSNVKSFPYKLPLIFLGFVFIQISIGALVSGLDAGKIYQSWPLMNQSYFPDDSDFSVFLSLKLFEEPSIVQFIHRNLAYFIVILFSLIFYIVFKNSNLLYLRKATFLVFFSLVFQIFLGIFTIISGAHIILASAHQIGSILLITASLFLVYKNTNFS
jgi:heme a synthase